ncbi:MAG: NUDIX domain-containing protein [Bacteriovoracaceae bacterium]|jgi:8-oxo-dGTP pyrophosphatase MutT (NUDIX family)|nr:NUDIX domain-containing protein [Bacteriovoracaceae bacterium]
MARSFKFDFLKGVLPQKLSEIQYNSRFSELKTVVSVEDDWGGAVLCCIVEDSLLYIKRTESMPTHKGQVAFMGGHKQESECPTQTVLRELEEEGGIASEHIQIHGYLPALFTARKQLIIPVVGELSLTISELKKTIASNGEWDICFAVKIEALSDIEKWSYAQKWGAISDEAILFRGLGIHEVELMRNYGELVHNFVLWGATAHFTNSFLKAITDPGSPL